MLRLSGQRIERTDGALQQVIVLVVVVGMTFAAPFIASAFADAIDRSHEPTPAPIYSPYRDDPNYDLYGQSPAPSLDSSVQTP